MCICMGIVCMCDTKQTLTHVHISKQMYIGNSVPDHHQSGFVLSFSHNLLTMFYALCIDFRRFLLSFLDFFVVHLSNPLLCRKWILI